MKITLSPVKFQTNLLKTGLIFFLSVLICNNIYSNYASVLGEKMLSRQFSANEPYNWGPQWQNGMIGSISNSILALEGTQSGSHVRMGFDAGNRKNYTYCVIRMRGNVGGEQNGIRIIHGWEGNVGNATPITSILHPNSPATLTNEFQDFYLINSNIRTQNQNYDLEIYVSSGNKIYIDEIFYTNVAPIDNNALSSPVLSVSSKTSTSLNLSWTSSSGADYYELYRCSNASGSCTTPLHTNLQATSYQDAGLESGVTYYYQVIAKASNKNNGVSAILSAATKFTYNYVPFSSGTCYSSCPTQLVGRVDFSNKNGNNNGRWTLNDIETYGSALQSITSPKQSTGGNVKNTGNYTIVENPKTLNESLQDIETSGVFVVQSTDDVLVYTLRGLNTPVSGVGNDKLKYCIRIKMRNVGTTNNCSNNVGNNITIQIKNPDGKDFSNGSRLYDAAGNRGYNGKLTVSNSRCSNANGRTGTWNGNDQINPNPIGYAGDYTVFEGCFMIGAGRGNENEFKNDDGFQIIINGPDNNGDNVTGIEEIEVYGCMPVVPEEITSSKGEQVSAGTTTTLTVSGICPSTASNYQWRIGDAAGTVLPSTTNTINVTVDKTTTYWVSCGGKSLSITIAVPKEMTSSSGDSFCDGTTTTLKAVGIGSNTDTYVWTETSNGVTTTLQSQTASVQVTPRSGTTIYTVGCGTETLSRTIEASNCCAIKNSEITLTKICAPINIDGNDDDPVWSMMPWKKIDGSKSLALTETGAGGCDCSSGRAVETNKLAQWRSAYDGENLYFYIRTFDPNPRKASEGIEDKPWSQDGVEIYLERTDNTSKPLQFGYTWNGNNSVLSYPTSSTPISTVAAQKYAAYWDLEIKIPIATNNIKMVNGSVRMEVAINQARDNEKCRTAQVFTWNAANYYDSSLSALKQVYLNDCLQIQASETEICSGQSITLTTSLTNAVWEEKPINGNWAPISGAAGQTITVTPQSNGIQYRAQAGNVLTCPITVAISTDCPPENIQSCANANMGDAKYVVQKVCAPPVVAEDWRMAAWQSVNVPFTLATNVDGNCNPNGVLQLQAGKWRAVYDDKNIYFLIRVNDPNPYNNIANNNFAWKNDAVEIYIKNKLNAPKQHGVGYGETNDLLKPYGGLKGTQELVSKTSEYWEIKITIPANENDIDLTSEYQQIEVGINQSAYDATCRSAQLFTWTAANHYQESTAYSKVKLSNCLQTQASKTEVCAGENITISTLLTASTNYTWQQKTAPNGSWTIIPGATGNSVVVSPTIDGTQYQVIVDNELYSCPVVISTAIKSIALADKTSYCHDENIIINGLYTSSKTNLEWAWKKSLSSVYSSAASFVSGYDWNNNSTKTLTKKAQDGDAGYYFFVVREKGSSCESVSPPVHIEIDTDCGNEYYCFGANAYFEFTIPKTCDVITIDGKGNETAWSYAPWQEIDGSIKTTLADPLHDCKGNECGVLEKNPAGMWRATYDNNNIYFSIRVYDANPHNNSGSYYGDGVEIFIKTGTSTPRQYGIAYGKENIYGNSNPLSGTHKFSKSDNYWEVEVSIPIASNNIDISSGVLDMELSINQSPDNGRGNNNEEYRVAQLSTWKAANHYATTKDYHSVPMSNCSLQSSCNGGTTTSTFIKKTDKTITIEGKEEGEWNAVPWTDITVEHYLKDKDHDCEPNKIGAAQPSPAGKWRALYDDKNIYFYVRVYNNEKPYNGSTGNDNNAYWWQDGVEIYINNSKQYGYTYRNGTPYTYGTATNKGNAWITTNAEAGTWDFKVSIPLAKNNINVSTGSLLMEVAINQSSSAGCRSAQVFTWKAADHFNTSGYLTAVPLNSCSTTGNAGETSIQKVCKIPKLDEVVEEEWKVAAWTKISIPHSINSATAAMDQDCPKDKTQITNPAGKWRAVYDDQYIYFNVKVFDNEPHNNKTATPADGWTQDGVEIYITDKKQYGYAYNSTSYPVTYGTATDKGISRIIKNTDGTWDLLVQIPITANNLQQFINGGFIPMEVAINESLGTENCRSAQLFTWTAANHYSVVGKLHNVSLSNCLQTQAAPREIVCSGTTTLSAGIASTLPNRFYYWEQSIDGGNTWLAADAQGGDATNNNVIVTPTVNGVRYRAHIGDIYTCPVAISVTCPKQQPDSIITKPCEDLVQIRIEEPTCDKSGRLDLIVLNNKATACNAEWTWIDANGMSQSVTGSKSLENVQAGIYQAKIINCANLCTETIQVEVLQNMSAENGLMGTYKYATGKEKQQIDPTVNYSWGNTNAPQSVIWEGCLTTPCDEESGGYIFYIPEGGKLYIDGKLIIGK